MNPNLDDQVTKVRLGQVSTPLTYSHDLEYTVEFNACSGLWEETGGCREKLHVII